MLFMRVMAFAPSSSFGRIFSFEPVLTLLLFLLNFIPNLGGYAEEETPGPIPNPEAKLFKADDTASLRRWESRSLP